MHPTRSRVTWSRSPVAPTSATRTSAPQRPSPQSPSTSPGRTPRTTCGTHRPLPLPTSHSARSLSRQWPMQRSTTRPLMRQPSTPTTGSQATCSPSQARRPSPPRRWDQRSRSPSLPSVPLGRTLRTTRGTRPRLPLLTSPKDRSPSPARCRHSTRSTTPPGLRPTPSHSWNSWASRGPMPSASRTPGDASG